MIQIILDNACGEAHIGKYLSEAEKHGGYGQQAKVLLGEYARQDKQLEHLQRRGGECPHCVPFYPGYRLAA